MRRVIVLTALTALSLVACASGPSPAALDRNELPSATTTTEPPPEGVLVVIICDRGDRYLSSDLFAPTQVAP